jgi:hypothetical protein
MTVRIGRPVSAKVRRSIERIDRVKVPFDEPNLVAMRSLRVSPLAIRLGLDRLITATIHLSGPVGGAPPERNVITLVRAYGTLPSPRCWASGHGALHRGRVPPGPCVVSVRSTRCSPMPRLLEHRQGQSLPGGRRVSTEMFSRLTVGRRLPPDHPF